MRIGDIDYLYKLKTSGTSEPAAGTEMPELTEKQRKRKKWKNWWYYHKWHVICGLLLLGILIQLAGSYLGLWTRVPDLQIAYVGKRQLPPDTVSALEKAFASLASDFNGDGKIIVRINQYTDGLKDADPDMLYYEYASDIALIGDISDCDSYFFLMDDPDRFQREFQLLALPDGSCPNDADYSVKDKVILWSDCPLLAEMELGSYSVSRLGAEVSGSNQELLAGLFLGRRCFFTDDITDHADKCDRLWNLLFHKGED